VNPSQEITKLRKDGRLDDAYRLALDLFTKPDADERVKSAYAWCLIELVRRHGSGEQPDLLREYVGRLAAFRVPRGDDLLAEHRRRALALSDERGREIADARKLGKEGRHEDAVCAFSVLLSRGDLDGDNKVSFGWELFKANQAVLRAARSDDLAPGSVSAIKQRLNTYLKLSLAGPDLLHSCILQQAARLADKDHLRLVSFTRLWKLESFRTEDYEENTAPDGKVFPSLAEMVLQRASKEAAKGGLQDDAAYILPHVERALERFPDNVWLKLNLVKLLRGLDRIDDARGLAVDFARSKAGEYWTWELLGDLEADSAIRRSCYAKALSCSEDDKFTSKVRLKFARLLVDDHPGQARGEVERVIESRRRDGTRIPSEALLMAQSTWFTDATSTPTGRSFYNRHMVQAEELLFAHLPWIDASIGDEVVIDGQDGQKSRTRRRIYVRGSPVPLEISVSASHPDVRLKGVGGPVKLQMETVPGEPWRNTVHRIQTRESREPYDVTPEMCGIIDHVNRGNALLHFVVAKDLDGTCPLVDFQGVAEAGGAIAVRMVRYHTKKGPRIRILSISTTTETPGEDVYRAFHDEVEVRNGLGFTSTGIFIPPDLVASAAISNGDDVEGMAVINFNRKRGTWGWKAIKARPLVACAIGT
jgi:hypothetical protein